MTGGTRGGTRGGARGGNTDVGIRIVSMHGCSRQGDVETTKLDEEKGMEGVQDGMREIHV